MVERLTEPTKTKTRPTRSCAPDSASAMASPVALGAKARLNFWSCNDPSACKAKKKTNRLIQSLRKIIHVSRKHK